MPKQCPAQVDDGAIDTFEDDDGTEARDDGDDGDDGYSMGR